MKNSADGFNRMSKLDVREEQVNVVEDDMDDIRHMTEIVSVSL